MDSSISRELRGAAVDRDRHHLRRLGAEQVSRGVDAVDADVVQRAAAHVAFSCGCCPRRTVMENDELKNLGVADASATHELDGLQVDLLEVQPIRDHQLHAMLVGRPRSSRSQSLAVTAIGFSHSTWTPAAAARIVYSACIELGSAMYTASTCSRHCS